MTWKTARRALTKRWWFLVLCALLAGAVAAFVVHRTPRNYTVSMTIRDVPGLGIGASQVAGTNATLPTLTLQTLPKNGWTVANWSGEVPNKTLQQQIQAQGLAITPAKFRLNLKLPAAQQENPKGLKVTNLKSSLLTFTYQTSSNPKAYAALVQNFLTTALNIRRAALEKQIPKSIKGFQTDAKNTKNGDATAAQNATGTSKGTAGQHEYQHDQSAISALQGMQALGLANLIKPVQGGATFAVTKKPMRAEYAAVGGAIIGLLAGALILLAIRWGRGRITDETELVPLEKPIIVVDSRTGEGFETLRAELEVAGIGAATAVVAVGTAQNGDGRSDLALELARTFARAGISTAFVSANPLAPGEMAGNGTAAFLGGTEAVLETIPVQPDLVWVPYGDEPEEGVTVTAENAQALVSAVRLFARAIVIEIAPVESDPSARLFAHCADALVLQVNRNRSRGARVYNAALTLHRASRAPLVVCFETGPLGRRNSATEPERIMAPPVRATAGAPSGS